MRLDLTPSILCVGLLVVSCKTRDFNPNSTQKTTTQNSPSNPNPDFAPPKSCPKGFVPVPGNRTPGLGSNKNIAGVPGFCLAKYEMKHPDDKEGWNRGILLPGRDKQAIPVSQPEYGPWVEITRDEAIAACGRMGPGFTLISNSQWMTVARNIEETASNWSDGAVGKGFLPKGHFDYKPLKGLPASRDDDPFSGLNISDHHHKRTLQLSNGEVVWDLAGNVAEFVSDNDLHKELDRDDIFRGRAPEIVNIRAPNTLSEKNRLLFSPKGDFGLEQNAGILTFNYYPVSSRGLAVDLGYISGVFQGGISEREKGFHNVFYGFRCVLN
jgi:hypothetical protein